MLYHISQINELEDENLTEEVYSLIYKYFDALIPSSELCSILSKKGILLVDDYRSIKENFIENFQDYAREKHGIDDLSTHIYDMGFLKKCYELYKGLINDSIKPGAYTKGIEELGLDINRFTPIIKDYGLKKNVEIKENVKSIPMLKAFKGILLENSKSGVREILNEYGRYEEKGNTYASNRLRALRNKTHWYAESKFGKEKREKIGEILEKKVDYVIEYNKAVAFHARAEANANRVEEEIKKRSEEEAHIIKEYIESKELLVKFINIKKMKKEKFMLIVSAVQEYNPDLYNEYIEHKNNEVSIRNEYRSLEVGIILNYIRNGITDEYTGEIRSFDLLDYYQHTQMPKDVFLDVLTTGYGYDDNVTAKRFFNKFKISVTDFNVNEKDGTLAINVMDLKFIKEEDQEPIKELIIGYLNGLGAPITLQLFKLAYYRYEDGRLDIADPKKYMIRKG